MTNCPGVASDVGGAAGGWGTTAGGGVAGGAGTVSNCDTSLDITVGKPRDRVLIPPVSHPFLILLFRDLFSGAGGGLLFLAVAAMINTVFTTERVESMAERTMKGRNAIDDARGATSTPLLAS